MIPDEQDTLITYYLGQELSEQKMSFDEYEASVRNIAKEEIIEYVKKVNVDTIYFLKN